ncbi:hypothetical protein HYPSUDRAFT_538571 [Hypholoma sublateritium FD-334 SS-4]|uniref:Uncharacterized protein n=1 Tax=Hypholoma sublateritium (strain FD-334 SS-4) TaxID=945553 RepID=A0A0D2P008_HYPSF|nr:hypothetical protein HYPSUDRAFT_538571 [Hypholoma sublateritium FD-334 SS-4]
MDTSPRCLFMLYFLSPCLLSFLRLRHLRARQHAGRAVAPAPRGIERPARRRRASPIHPSIYTSIGPAIHPSISHRPSTIASIINMHMHSAPRAHQHSYSHSVLLFPALLACVFLPPTCTAPPPLFFRPRLFSLTTFYE